MVVWWNVMPLEIREFMETLSPGENHPAVISTYLQNEEIQIEIQINCSCVTVNPMYQIRIETF